MYKELDIKLLVSYLSGNSTENEVRDVEAWINLSNDNRTLFNEFKQIWEVSASNNSIESVDLDARWDDLKSRLNFGGDVKVSKRSTVETFFIVSSGIAAFIALVISLWVVIPTPNKVNDVIITESSFSTGSSYILPDGSKSFLNVGSEIIYPNHFSSDIRRVEFTGEAYFDIAHDPNHPFLIESGNVRVKVLGTSFNLTNNPDSDEITIFLETGKVLFYSVDKESNNILDQVILLPGEKGVYNKVDGSISKFNFSSNNYLAWKTGTLNFVNAPLEDVISTIENTFQIDVKSKFSLENFHLTARYQNETSESILQSLKVIYGFDYVVDGNNVTIKK
ncbi:MAG: hypothetical protein CMF58_02280 [Lentimicrobiaceae bacterium]|jgi:transmembrane sensor|nr:hypothetical protein [Lentimicrobiaceae bacterium]|tara:strand:- start:6224 stop:7228 length:1005 start_codon:yes stop_codon:yes gene_type:complete